PQHSDTLKSVIDGIAAVDPLLVSDDDLEAGVAVFNRAVSRLEALMARWAGEAKRRGSFQREGLVSLTRWLAFHADMDNGHAKTLVGLAATMNAHPATGSAVASGDLSHTRAGILSRAASQHPKVYERDEAMLLGFARDQSIRDLNHSLRYWRHCADDTVAEADAATQRDAAYLHASVTWAGMVRLDGLLDPEAGEALLTALDAATAPPSEGDLRPAPNRRAEALGAICEQWLRNGTIDGGLRAAVTLTVDLDTLNGGYGKHCNLEHTGPVTAATAVRSLCDADVCRVITQGASEILDLGRTTRVPSPALRRALNLRDGHCRFRGCDRPATWCDSHHVVHWLRGGTTCLENLKLLCRHHHVMLHGGRAYVSGNDVLPITDNSPPHRDPPDRPSDRPVTTGTLRQ
ncbi:MAG: HNH endonuclease, partial [Actinomycetota bacterium]|nr:HNH endonuclease [Actinomycetota bacterium]